jgi:hypothetical protein
MDYLRKIVHEGKRASGRARHSATKTVTVAVHSGGSPPPIEWRAEHLRGMPSPVRARH